MQGLFSIMMPVVLLFCGLAIDVGMLELRMAQLQTAADAAALGAEIEAERGTNNWVAMGKAESAQNGYTDGVNGVTVTLQEQPTSGPYANRFDALQATVTLPVTLTFLRPIYHGTFTLSASASSLVTPCIYLTGTGSLQSPDLRLYTGDWDSESCPIWVNENININNWANINVEAINVAGSSGSSTVAGETYPTPRYSAGTVSDPLSYVTSPSFSGTCNHTSYSLSNGNATLNPGTFCKGLNLTNSTVTLNAGLYVITGSATWSNSTVTGTGVTLFFTQGGGGSYGQFQMTNGSNVTLSAPTSTSGGGVTNVLVFADRNWVHSGAQDFVCNNSTFYGDGIWYLTNAGFGLWSCGVFTAPNYLGVIADNSYSAGTNFQPKNNYSGTQTGNPFRLRGALVQ